MPRYCQSGGAEKQYNYYQNMSDSFKHAHEKGHYKRHNGLVLILLFEPINSPCKVRQLKLAKLAAVAPKC
jgi:hypothetical protein